MSDTRLNLRGKLARAIANAGFSQTLDSLRWEMLRRKARRSSARMLAALGSPIPDKLHLGSGTRRVKGWLNCDVVDSDVDADLAGGALPFPSAHFAVVCSQHVIEHLSIERELPSLFAEVHRVLQPNGRFWVSCPDLEKVCRGYVADGARGLIDDRLKRLSWSGVEGYPDSHMVNVLFHQGGQHKNLFDLSLLKFMLERAGFREVRRTDEAELLGELPGFPPRYDDYQSLYVVATK